MKRAHTAVFLVVFVPLTLIALALAITSLSWPMMHDTPVVLYLSYLIDHFHLAPYRDFWDINLPGTYLVYALIGHLVGYSNDMGLRVFDLAFLAALGAFTALWLKPLGWKVGWAAACLFALVYLSGGPGVVLQREYLALLPLMAAVFIATRLPRLNDLARAGLVGLLFGLMATMKPHLALGFPVVAAFGTLYWRDRQAEWIRRGPALLRLAAVAIVGLALPLAGMAAYMAASGVLPYYLDIALHYYPLYARVTGNLTILASPGARVQYLVINYLKLGRQWEWLIAAGPALMGVLTSGAATALHRRQVSLLAWLAAAYSIYPLFSGQFFSYHWLPYVFCIVILAAVCATDLALALPRAARWAPAGALALAVALFTSLYPGVGANLAAYYLGRPTVIDDQVSRADDMARQITARMQPGDVVQPLDWVDGGVLHALLIAKAKPATPYVADMLFYHDVSTPYIQRVRRDLLNRLSANPPRFVLDFQYVTWIRGPDSASDFPELRLWLADHYRTAAAGNTYQLDERARADDPPGSRALVVVGPQPFVLTQWSSLFPNRPVTLIDSTQPLDPAKVASTLSSAARGSDFLTLVFMAKGTDPDHVLEGRATQDLYRLGEWPGAYGRVIDYFVGGPGCQETQPSTGRFGERIDLTASAIGLVPKPGNWVVCVRLEWQAEKPIAENYKVAVHIVDASGALVAQYDSLPQGGLLPTSRWQPGQTVIDPLAIRLPASLPAGRYGVRLIVYDEASGQRLPAADGQASGDSILIGSLEVP